MDFPRRREQTERAAKGESFLATAKKRFSDIFTQFLDQSETYSSIETYTDALEKEAWQFCEQLAKQSWHNGVGRGQDGRRGSATRP